MSIKWSEVAGSGISESDFNSIAADDKNFVKAIEIARYNPVFTYHSNGGRAHDLPFSTRVFHGHGIVRAYLLSGQVYAEFLPTENVDQTILGSWTTPVLLGNSTVPPVVCYKRGYAYTVGFVDSSGYIKTCGSNNGSTWSSPAQLYSTSVSNVEWLSWGATTETMYVVKNETGNRHILCVTSTGIYDSEVYWPFPLSGFDCELFYDESSFPASAVANSWPGVGSPGHNDASVRHCLVFQSNLPSTYTYKNVNGSPVKTTQDSGGLMSFVVSPAGEGGRFQYQFTPYNAVETFDLQTPAQFRRGAHISTSNSLVQPINDNDILYASCMGADGDSNTEGTGYSYNAMYYYTSRNGRDWSQCQLIMTCVDTSTNAPINNNWLIYDHALIKSGKYLYIIGSSSCGRSLLPAAWGTDLHPALKLDVSALVTDYSSNASDVRQTSVTLSNHNNALGSFFMNNPGRYVLYTKIGAVRGGVPYYFNVSYEFIDTIQPDRERPGNHVKITARDVMSLLTDRVENINSLQYDSQLVGRDTFTNANGTENTGLAHTAVQTGTWATIDNKLRLRSAFKEGIAFNTFKTSVANGSASAMIEIIDPTLHTAPDGSTATSSNAPTAAGVIFHAADKDNFWRAQYNWWTNHVELVYRSAGVDSVMAYTNPDSNTNFSGIAHADETTQHLIHRGGVIGIRVEFRYSLVRVYLAFCNQVTSTVVPYYGVLIPVLTYVCPASTLTLAALGSGYVGMYSIGYSDLDTGDGEVPPVIIVPPPPPPPINNPCSPLTFPVGWTIDYGTTSAAIADDNGYTPTGVMTVGALHQQSNGAYDYRFEAHYDVPAGKNVKSFGFYLGAEGTAAGELSIYGDYADGTQAPLGACLHNINFGRTVWFLESQGTTADRNDGRDEVAGFRKLRLITLASSKALYEATDLVDHAKYHLAGVYVCLVDA